MQVTEENELLQSLQSMIALYLDKNPQLTLNALAQRSNVPVTSMRRLVSGQQKNEIAPHTVLNIVSYILREKNLSELFKKVDACIADFLQKHFGNFVFASRERIFSTDLNTELKDEIKYMIYKMAANHDGVDFMTVVENFGSLGKRKAVEMISSGVLVEEGQRFHAKEKNFSLDLETAASHLPGLMRFYKPRSLSKGLNTFFNMSEALNEEGIMLVKKLQRDCVLAMNEIMINPEYLGHIPYFTINLAETMLPEEQSIGEIQ